MSTTLNTAMDAIDRLSKKESAWCWLADYGTDVAMVVVSQGTDPKAADFARQVGLILGERGEASAAVRGMLTRLPSGALSLAIREAPDAIAAMHTTLCGQTDRMPSVTIIQMKGTNIVKAVSSQAPGKAAPAEVDPFADPFGDIGGEEPADDIWGALM